MRSLKLLGLVTSLFLIATPGRASDVTVSFSGTVNLSSVGGSTSNMFSGSVTWDPSVAPFNTALLGGGQVESQYDAVSDSFTFNSINVSTVTGMPQLLVYYVPGQFTDVNVSFEAIPGAVVLGTNSDLLAFGADLVTSAGVLNSASPPSNLNFLESLKMTDSVWLTETLGVPNSRIISTLTTPVVTSNTPEPNVAGLLAIGIGALLLLQKRLP